MARGEQRRDDEAKNPKNDKPTEATLTSPFTNQVKGGPPAKLSGGKRWRLSHRPVNGSARRFDWTGS